MSSFRNAAPRREHWERSQLASRGKLGLLEKKKDYILRAKNYHTKEKRLTVLREKARFRNPDEFYFSMQSSSTLDGIHKIKKARLLGPDGVPYSDDMIHLLKTQDWTYLKNQVLIEQNKIKDLEGTHTWLRYLPQLPLEGTHIVFDDSDVETSEANVVEEDSDVETSLSPSLKGAKDLHVDEGLKNKVTAEWTARKKRLSQMLLAEKELFLKNHLSNSKGRRKRVGKDINGQAIFKWNTQRSK